MSQHELKEVSGNCWPHNDEELAKLITKWLRLIVKPGSITELRVIEHAHGKDYRPIRYRYFDYDNLDGMGPEALTLSKTAYGTYFLLNPCVPDLLARCKNPTQIARTGDTTSNDLIIERCWLPIDIDAIRPTDTNSTNAERDAAFDLAFQIKEFFIQLGWSLPIVADSANGAHMLYRIQLPCNDGELVKSVLTVMAAKFKSDYAKVDTTVFNTARIWKAYGTTPQKGPHTAERPQRPARILELPGSESPFDTARAKLQLVSREQLECFVAAYSPKPERVTVATHSPGSNGHMRHDTDRAVMERARKYVAKCPHAIQGQNGSGKTFRVACVLVIDFDLSEAEAMEIMREYSQRCEPPWSEKELLHKVQDAIKKQGPRGRLRNMAFERLASIPLPDHQEVGYHYDEVPPSSSSTDQTCADGDGQTNPPPKVGYRYRAVDSATLVATAQPPEWLVANLIVKGQPGVVGAPTKGMKTSIMVDLVISLGTGTPFLGMFLVPKPCRVCLLSGESGKFTIYETAERVCRSKGIHLADVSNCHWDFELPQLSVDDDLAELQRGLRKDQIEVVIVDPLYLALLSGSKIKAENFYETGPLFLKVARTCLDVGCLPLLVHHFKQTKIDYDPPDLSDLAYSGIQQFARQWLLLNRREKYAPGTGQHKLWLSAGGSVGHSGLWAVDIDEGQLADDFSGKKWEVSVTTQSEVIQARKTEAKAEKQQKISEIENDQENKLLKALDRLACQDGIAGYTEVRDAASLNNAAMTRTVIRLVDKEIIEQQPTLVSNGTGKKKAKGLRRVRYDEFLIRTDRDSDRDSRQSRSAG